MFARDQVGRLFLSFCFLGGRVFFLPFSLLSPSILSHTRPIDCILNEMRLLITSRWRLIIKVVAPFPQTQERTFFFAFVFSAMIGSSHSSLFPLVPSGWTLVVGS
jgi:hypothetical protein